MQYLDSTEAGEILAHGDEEATANQYVMENDDEKVEAEENKVGYWTMLWIQRQSIQRSFLEGWGGRWLHKFVATF